MNYEQLIAYLDMLGMHSVPPTTTNTCYILSSKVWVHIYITKIEVSPRLLVYPHKITINFPVSIEELQAAIAETTKIYDEATYSADELF